MFKVTIKRRLAFKFKDIEAAYEYRDLLNVFIPKGRTVVSDEGDYSCVLTVYDNAGCLVGYVSEIEGYNNEKL